MVNRVIVGAHYGLRDWLGQRVTAFIMAIYSFGFLMTVLVCAPSTFEKWVALFSSTWFRLATFLFLISLFYHVWVGMRDILMDYVASTLVRLGLQIIVIIMLFVYVGWSIDILWSAKI